MNLTIGLFLGLVLGIVAAWVREQLDSSIKTPDDVETLLGVTCLGLLPEVDENQDAPAACAAGVEPRSERPKRPSSSSFTTAP